MVGGLSLATVSGLVPDLPEGIVNIRFALSGWAFPFRKRRAILSNTITTLFIHYSCS